MGKKKYRFPPKYHYSEARKALLRLGAIPTGKWHGSHEVLHYINPKDGKLAVIHLIKHSSQEIPPKTMYTQLQKMGVPKQVFLAVYFGEDPPAEWVSRAAEAFREAALGEAED